MKNFFLPLQFLLLLANFSLATPYPAAHALEERADSCLTFDQGNQIVDAWRSLFVNFNKTVAMNSLTMDFQYFSDSQNSGTPGAVAGTPIAANRSQFIEELTASSAGVQLVRNISITPQVVAVGCSKISFRWKWHGLFNLDGPIVTQGFSTTDKNGDLIEYHGIDMLVLKPGTHLIQTAYSEYDGIGLLYQLGVYVCFQKDNATHCAM